MNDVEDRLDRLESILEQQQETIESQRDRIESQAATIDRQRDRIDDLESDGDSARSVTRRDAIRAGGILALLGLGSAATGTASADPRGQVGTADDPLEKLHTEELNGGVTGEQAVTDLLGTGLSVDGGSLGITSGGVGSAELVNDSVTIAGNSVSLGGSTGIAHPDLSGIGSSDHHTRPSAGDGLTASSDTFDVDPAAFAGRNLTASGGNLDYVPPENVLVVAKSGGDYTSVSGALGSIGDNAADNPYVVRVAPGVYDESVQLKSYVDVVGSGIHATRIETTQTLAMNGTLQADGATEAEVRRLTVQGDAAALSVDDSASDVTVNQARIRQDNNDTSRAIYHDVGTLRLQHCLVNAKSSSSEGIEKFGGTLDVSYCRVQGTALAIENIGGAANVRHSQLVGGTSNLSNKFSVCDGSYNAI